MRSIILQCWLTVKCHAGQMSTLTQMMDGWKLFSVINFQFERQKIVWIQNGCLQICPRTLFHTLFKQFDELGLAYSNTAEASMYCVYCTEWEKNNPSLWILNVFTTVKANYRRQQSRILKASGGVKEDEEKRPTTGIPHDNGWSLARQREVQLLPSNSHTYTC